MKKKAYQKFLMMFLSMGIVASFVLQGCGNSDKQETSLFSNAKTKETVEKETKEKEVETKTADIGSETTEAGIDSVDDTDTVRWINAAHAILTDCNGQDYTMYGCMEPTADNQTMAIASLDEWWGVTDRESADEMIDWLLTEGHRTDFVNFIGTLDECGFSLLTQEERKQVLVENFELEEDTAAIYANYYKMYEQYGPTAIDAWDYSRGLTLCCYYYIAGYYTKEEALDTALEFAIIMQSGFESWDDLVDSYLRGYEYWSDSDSSERREVYEDLCKRADNPYAVDYHTVLTKEW